MIIGWVVRGCGHASEIPEEMFRARCEAVAVDLVRGTLNVCVHNLRSVVAGLGPPHNKTDEHNRTLGPLHWWKAEVFADKLPKTGVRALIVRHTKTGTKYLELMSDVSFREEGLEFGEQVRIKLLDQDDPPKAK